MKRIKEEAFTTATAVGGSSSHGLCHGETIEPLLPHNSGYNIRCRGVQLSPKTNRKLLPPTQTNICGMMVHDVS